LNIVANQNDVSFPFGGLVRILDIPHKPWQGGSDIERGRDRYHEKEHTWWSDGPRLEFSVLSQDIDELCYRITLVEDLSPPLIDALGAIFAVKPVFFETHLIGSRYNKVLSPDDWKLAAEMSGPTLMSGPTYITPRTQHCQQFSLRWWRPLRRQTSHFLFEGRSDWEHFLEFPQQFLNSPARTEKHKKPRRPNENIFRKEWDLTDYNDLRWGNRPSTVACEERISIHSEYDEGKCQKCKP